MFTRIYYQYYRLFDLNGKIDFSKAQSISFNFVNLYVIFKLISQVTGTNIVFLAPVIPPFLNILTTTLVFLISKRFFSLRLAILSTMLFGWESQIILFGTEFRTQTIGTLLFFILVLLFIINQETVEENKKFNYFLIIIVLFAIVTSSFLSSILCFMFILTILIAIIYFKYIKKAKIEDVLITKNILIMLLVFFLFYMIYIGIGFDNILSSTFNLVVDTFSSESCRGNYYPHKTNLWGFCLIYATKFLNCSIYFRHFHVEKCIFKT